MLTPYSLVLVKRLIALPQLFQNFHRGSFSYFIALADGEYSVTLDFLEPSRTAWIGEPGGHLKLDFMPARGDAIVSNISIRRQ